MASYIDMSLDDIIQKTKKRNSKYKSNVNKQKPPVKQNVVDARNKIISKKRTQIVDAREKLAELARQKDARLRLEQMRAKRAIRNVQGGSNFQTPRKFTKHHAKMEPVFTDRSRQVISQPLTRKTLRNQSFTNKRITMDRSIESRNLAKPLKPIIRTIENDLEIIDDPMEEDHVPVRTALSNGRTGLQLKIVTHNNNIQRSTVIDKEKSPPRPPSILKKRPMAALRSENKTEKPEKPNHEYRIIVSNLRNTVTAGDIEELFGDVGGMVESRLVRPGTAEVIYKSVEDAQVAVDLYHNRQLDGQPMNCLLVTPRSTSTSARSSNKPALYSTNSNVEPDISTFHKVLFSNF
ncbi:unnamed protein product, partial [Brenthis ino]